MMTLKGVIEMCKFLCFQGRLFSVKKRDSLERRAILDLLCLSKFIQCDKFKIITITQVWTCFPQGVHLFYLPV